MPTNCSLLLLQTRPLADPFPPRRLPTTVALDGKLPGIWNRLNSVNESVAASGAGVIRRVMLPDAPAHEEHEHHGERQTND